MPKGIKGFQKGNKLGKANIGRSPVNSPETRRKISETQKRTGKRPPLRMKGFKCSIETRKKMSDANKGSKCHFWKGGIAPMNKIMRMSVEYKLWREAVFKRDNWTCIWCGFKGYVQADHIKPFALFPELRFSIDNGRTLCVLCHKTTDTYGGKTNQCKPR